MVDVFPRHKASTPSSRKIRDKARTGPSYEEGEVAACARLGFGVAVVVLRPLPFL